MNNEAEYGGRSLKSRISRLLGDSTTSDIKFLVGEELQEFPAHKLIFAASSNEFWNGFYAMTPADNIINLPEIKVESFKEFLSYIYTEEATINPDNILDVMKLGDRYAIHHLMDFCYENAARFIDDQPHLCDDLLKLCKFTENEKVFLDKIEKDPSKYLSVDNIGSLNKEFLKVILESKETKLSEKQLFDFAVMWASKKTSSDNPMEIRTFLGDLILFIRFPTMTMIEFEKCIQEHPGILASEDIIEILLYIGKQCGNCKYSVDKRHIQNVDLDYIDQCLIRQSDLSHIVKAKCYKPLYFSVKKACSLNSISYYVNGKLNEKLGLCVTVNVCGPHVNVIQIQRDNYCVKNFYQRKSIELCTIDLKEIVILHPHKDYSIQLDPVQGAAEKFKRIMISLPKMKTYGNIKLSRIHDDRVSNESSPISSICYRFN